MNKFWDSNIENGGEFVFEANKEKLINNLDMLSEMPVEEQTLYKKWQEFNSDLHSSMMKLRDNLLEMNNSFTSKKHDGQYDMKGFIKINEEKIIKKYSDFKEKSEIKNIVSTKFSEIFNDKKNESMDIAKAITNSSNS